MEDMPAEFASPLLTPWPRDIALPVRLWAFVVAVFELVLMECGGLFGFRLQRRIVAAQHVVASRKSYDALTLVRVAVRDACLCYPKTVFCLQRSAVVTRMLRRRGLAAQLVIGYQPMPVQSHAWVELDGRVVWDDIQGREYYHVVDRI